MVPKQGQPSNRQVLMDLLLLGMPMAGVLALAVAALQEAPPTRLQRVTTAAHKAAVVSLLILRNPLPIRRR